MGTAGTGDAHVATCIMVMDDHHTHERVYLGKIATLKMVRTILIRAESVLAFLQEQDGPQYLAISLLIIPIVHKLGFSSSHPSALGDS